MGAIADHLWQSTWFALAAGVLALFVREDAAKIRFWVWLAASIKFLFPFALLNWIGGQFILQVEDERAFLPMMQHVAWPLTAATIPAGDLSGDTQRFLSAAWALVSAMLFGRLLVSWLHSRVLVRRSVPCAVAAPIPVRCSDRIAEPGVVGIVEPVILLPTDLLSSLSPAEIGAVIGHEMGHVRRHDNLIACLHSSIEALFWFHPLVWWVGAQLVRERERACDEGAIEEGNEPRIYAAALLTVCRHAFESNTSWIARATGGDLNARIRGIMLHEKRTRRGMLRRFILAAVFLGCAALPVASGMNVVVASAFWVDAGTRSIRVSEAAGPAIIVMREDYVYGRGVSLRELIGRAYSVRAADVAGALRWLDSPRYDLELRGPAGGKVHHRQLVADLLEQRFNVELIERSR